MTEDIRYQARAALLEVAAWYDDRAGDMDEGIKNATQPAPGVMDFLSREQAYRRGRAAYWRSKAQAFAAESLDG